MSFASHSALISYLKKNKYIKSDLVLDIMRSVDRKHFTPNNRHNAYADKIQLVAHGKHISAPHLHAILLEQMLDHLQRGTRALDIGAGSGYLTVCMALALGEKGRVIAVDCFDGLQKIAVDIVFKHYPKLMKNDRFMYIVGDGRVGFPRDSPYDVIHVGFAVPSIPQTLIDQIALGGCLLIPVGSGKSQTLTLLRKSLEVIVHKKEIMAVSYGSFEDVNPSEIQCVRCPSSKVQPATEIQTVNVYENNIYIGEKSQPAKRVNMVVHSIGNKNDRGMSYGTKGILKTPSKKQETTNVNIKKISFPYDQHSIVISNNENQNVWTRINIERDDKSETKSVQRKTEIFEKKVDDRLRLVQNNLAAFTEDLKRTLDGNNVKVNERELIIKSTDKKLSIRELRERLAFVTRILDSLHSQKYENLKTKFQSLIKKFNCLTLLEDVLFKETERDFSRLSDELFQKILDDLN